MGTARAGAIYGTLHLRGLCPGVARGLDRRPADRAASGNPDRRYRHRIRALRPCDSRWVDLLPGSGPGSYGHRAPEAKTSSAVVAGLYPEKDARRDAGFSIFYMGINVGAFFGPGICSLLGEKVDWHLGFGVAGVGMTLAVIQYVRGAKHLGTAGLLKAEAQEPKALANARRQLWTGIGVVLVARRSPGGCVSGWNGLFQHRELRRGYLVCDQRVGDRVLCLRHHFRLSGWVGKKAGRVDLRPLRGCCTLLVGLRAGRFDHETFLPRIIPTSRSSPGRSRRVGCSRSIPFFIVLLAPLMGMLWVGLGTAKTRPLGAKFGLGTASPGRGLSGHGMGLQLRGRWASESDVAGLYLLFSTR